MPLTWSISRDPVCWGLSPSGGIAPSPPRRRQGLGILAPDGLSPSLRAGQTGPDELMICPLRYPTLGFNQSQNRLAEALPPSFQRFFWDVLSSQLFYPIGF